MFRINLSTPCSGDGSHGGFLAKPALLVAVVVPLKDGGPLKYSNEVGLIQSRAWLAIGSFLARAKGKCVSW